MVMLEVAPKGPLSAKLLRSKMITRPARLLRWGQQFTPTRLGLSSQPQDEFRRPEEWRGLFHAAKDRHFCRCWQRLLASRRDVF